MTRIEKHTVKISAKRVCEQMVKALVPELAELKDFDHVELSLESSNQGPLIDDILVLEWEVEKDD